MIVRQGYLTRKVSKGEMGYRNWWLIKYTSNEKIKTGQLDINHIYFPEEYVGKKIRLKVELVEENE